MLSMDYIRKNADNVKEMLVKRKSNISVDELLKIDEDVRACQVKLDNLKAERNQISKNRDEASIARGKQIKTDILNLEDEFVKLDEKRTSILHIMPNMLDNSVPVGASDADNVEIKKNGIIPKFDFEPKWHHEIGENLGILDAKAGVKVAGSGFTYWRGDGAKLLRAMFDFAIDTLQTKGFEFMFTPIMAHASTFFGTGYLPFGGDQIYKVEGEDLASIGTSEQTLLSYFMKTVVDVENPILLTAYTPCFRTEKGSYGKETKGVYRMHQFYKVEQIVICKPEDSVKYHEFCLANEEEFFQKLGIPYHVVNVCTGDLGAPASKKYDVEGWFPAYGNYRELTSNSNLLDFQARRLNIKYKKADGTTDFVHTISATGITERAFLAILENYQQKDGSVKIPDVLVPYMKGQTFIFKK